MTSYFALSIAILALLLFFPVSKLIWVLSVRRLQRKLGRELFADELAGQKTRARLLALPLVTLFSWIFNLQLLGTPHG